MGGWAWWLMRQPVRTVREAAHRAVEVLEDERFHSSTRARLAVGLLKTALLYDRERRDPSSRTRATDE